MIKEKVDSLPMSHGNFVIKVESPEEFSALKFVELQRALIEKEIGNFLQSSEFQNKKLQLLNVMRLEGTDQFLGNPLLFHALETSYFNMVFDRLEPRYGQVSNSTIKHIRSLFCDLVNPNDTKFHDGLKFCKATLVVNDEVPRNYIRWYY